MDECGIRGPTNDWFRNYLTNRKIRTVVSGVAGDEAPVDLGVPTGSVFGPVGYVMHVNSVANVVAHCRVYMYADDMCLVYAAKDIFQVQRYVQADFEELNGHQKALQAGVQNVKKTLSLLERSLHKSNKYEQKLLQCKKTHSHSHDKNKWCNSDQSEQKSSITNSSPVSVSVSGAGQTESWSTLSIVCLRYQLEDLSKRYEALLQAYDSQCSALSDRDTKLAQWRQRAKFTHAHLAHAHKALLTIGEKYLALKRKRHTLKSQYEERINQLKNILYDVVEVTSREQHRFDATLAYCMSSERSSDAALLLYEIRKCNSLLMENMRLKAIIEEVLPDKGYKKVY